MIMERRQPTRLRVLGRAFLSVAALALLWQLRPMTPLLPRSVSAPLTVETIEGVVLWLLWLVVGLLAVTLLVTALRARTRVKIARGPRLSRRPNRPPWRVRTATVRPSLPLLVVTDPEWRTRANGAGAASEHPGEHEPPSAEAVAAPSRPRISVLGPLTIAGAKRTRRGLRASALELIAYLALRRRQAQRDELLEAFWPGEDPKRTRLRLHQAVRDARRLLGTAVASERDRYWLERADVDADVDELDQLLAAARAADDKGDEQLLLERALGLFADEPLAGSDYLWAEGEVRRLRATYVDLLERVGRIRLSSGEARTALDAAERALAVDGLNEGLWRLALEAESALGLREAVDDRYERLRQVVGERLGLEPDRETRSLYRSLLAQR